MKPSIARLSVSLSLIVNFLAFFPTLIAFYFPSWKSVELPSNFRLITHSVDPLIRGELEKYLDLLYRPGQSHSFGLFEHCVTNRRCGRNLLPKFSPSHYAHCHRLDAHLQCLNTGSILSPPNLCQCARATYVKIIGNSFVIVLICQMIFLLVNFLRLYRQRYQWTFLDDIQFRLIALLSALLSSICTLIILIQHQLHLSHEPLQFLESMRRHYSNAQILSFANDLDFLIQQIQPALKIRVGSAFYSMIFVFIFSLMALLTSSIVEIKLKSPDDDEDEDEYYQKAPDPSKERFLRQTRV